MPEFTVTATELVLLAVGAVLVMRLLGRLVRWWVIAAVLALVLVVDFATRTGGVS